MTLKVILQNAKNRASVALSSSTNEPVEAIMCVLTHADGLNPHQKRLTINNRYQSKRSGCPLFPQELYSQGLK